MTSRQIAIAVASLMAALGEAQNLIPVEVIKYGESQKSYWETGKWSNASADGLYGLNLHANNNAYLRDGDYQMQTFSLRGGWLNFGVDFKGDFGCGCVAGVYLVDFNDCVPPTKEQGAQCRRIDVMVANPFGFQMAVKPCPDGDCSAASQCEYKMREQGIAKYGEGAYGPGGSIIDTTRPFDVYTAFLASEDDTTFWGIRTSLIQGLEANSGGIMDLEVSCPEYLAPLNDVIDGGFGLVASNWDNRDPKVVDFEPAECASAQAQTCENAVLHLEFMSFDDNGSNEKPPPEPEVPVLDENLQWFMASTDFRKNDVTYSGQPELWNFFVKGLPDRHLKTDWTSLELGYNNRVFLLDLPYDDSTYWAYFHDLLGGSLEFTVDVSQVGCGCAAGVFGVDLNDRTCSWQAQPDGTVPQCANIKLMLANVLGFNVASNPCPSGSCDVTTQCSANAYLSTTSAFGNDQMSLIDSTRPYTVLTRFFADQDKEGRATKLTKIETTLTQDEVNIVTLVQDCPEILSQLSMTLQSNMNIGISLFNAGTTNEINEAANQNCSEACSASSTLMIKDLRFTSHDSLNELPSEPVWGSMAPSLSAGSCGPDCVECREFWLENSPDKKSYQCFDNQTYRFGSACRSRDDRSSCAPGSLCHKSFPDGDPAGQRSPQLKCRSIPESYQIKDYSDWNISQSKCRGSLQGLCKYGCGAGECRRSWPRDDPLRYNSPRAMCRCSES